ncbi:MAG: prepilin-type N-terminal cleavage/methylation domain-containing protein [Alphaproteobacteria bacterium]|nr:prepilin-type N-terminal cleavage/methylation domain-containing protein [Alphaproteobacteria bacterium]
MRGFSLVELSIVLVILGLLTGGILAGQSLIRASELRAVTTEYQRYTAAGNTFRDKYFAIPGDFRDATRFWGRTVVAGHCVSNSGLAVAGTPGTCDGNGDGSVNLGGAGSQSAEVIQLWRHLALAGLIEGDYTGLAGAGGGGECVLGTNCPRSKLSNAGWGVWPIGNYAGDTGTYAYDYGNMLGTGAQWATAWPLSSAFRPEEVWNIDTKIDDGKPHSGRVLPRVNQNFGAAAACTTSTSQTDRTGDYKLTVTSKECSIHFAKAF